MNESGETKNLSLLSRACADKSLPCYIYHYQAEFYYIGSGQLSMAAVEARFEESFLQNLGGINLEKVLLDVEQKEATRNALLF